MTAAKYNLTIDQGSDFLTIFTVNNGTSPRDLAGYTASASLRPHVESSTVYHFNCGITTPTSTGKITMSLPSGITKNIPAGIYVYDLKISTGANAVERLLHGTVNIRRGITRP